MKKLGLKKEVLTDLSAEDLVMVGGAGADLPSAGITYTCTDGCVVIEISNSCFCQFTNRCTGC